MKNAQVPARSLLPRPASGKTEAGDEALSQKLGDRYRHCACAASLLYLQKGLWLRLMTGAPVPPAIAWKLLGQSCQSYSFCCPASIFQSHMSRTWARSEEHTSELQSLMRNSSAVFCLKKKKNKQKYNLQSDQVLDINTKMNRKCIVSLTQKHRRILS